MKSKSNQSWSHFFDRGRTLRKEFEEFEKRVSIFDKAQRLANFRRAFDPKYAEAHS